MQLYSGGKAIYHEKIRDKGLRDSNTVPSAVLVKYPQLPQYWNSGTEDTTMNTIYSSVEVIPYIYYMYTVFCLGEF